MPESLESMQSVAPLRDPFGRLVSYLRLSVTDRCNYRCEYCMTEDMTFLPRRDLLTLEELRRIAGVFIGLGANRLRITGGEPLVRRDIMSLFRSLRPYLDSAALQELTLTTNGTLLARHARELHDSGVRRINVSLDTLDDAKFRSLTRLGELQPVLDGIQAAAEAGLRVKINAVALRGINDSELSALLAWCGARSFDLALIESMPLGDVGGSREHHFMSLDEARGLLEADWTLCPSSHRTGGPARYFDVAETGTRLGLIAPYSHNFCESCNRVRLTCTGTLYMCLGQNDAVDLRQPLRDGATDVELQEVIRAAIRRKPRGHDFDASRLGDGAQVVRFMNTTGG